jgi:hypothetical protein
MASISTSTSTALTKQGKIKREQNTRALKDIIGIDIFDPNADRSLGSKMYRVPEHQRFPSWPLQYKVALIDTIFKDYPIGAIIVTTHVDSSREIYYNIQDGQTRLGALQEFMLNGLKWNGKTYADLTPQEQSAFDMYQVRIDNISPSKEMTQEEFDSHISDMFERLNSSKPLSDNDKFHNRAQTAVMKLLYKLNSAPEFCEQIRKFMWATVGEGKTRSNLKEFASIILSCALMQTSCITTSYAQNGPILVSIKDVESVQEERVCAFLRWYFKIINAGLQYVTKPKRVYGKLSGICGMMLCDWIQCGGGEATVRDGMWKQYIKIQYSREHFEKRIFSGLQDGDLRNVTPTSINSRIRTVIEAYEGKVFEEYMLDAFALLNSDAGSNPSYSDDETESESDD